MGECFNALCDYAHKYVTKVGGFSAYNSDSSFTSVNNGEFIKKTSSPFRQVSITVFW